MRASLHTMLVSCVGLALIAGCSQYDYDVPRIAFTSPTADLLAYYHQVKALSGQQLQAEYERVKASYEKKNNRTNALKLSLLLIASDAEMHNDSEAIAILEEVMGKTSHNTTRNLARLLRDILKESETNEKLYNETRKELAESVEESSKKEGDKNNIEKRMRELLREKNKRDMEHKALHKKLGEQEQLVEKLQRKIEELKMIERSINERKNSHEPTT